MMCSACAERDASYGRDVRFVREVRFLCESGTRHIACAAWHIHHFTAFRNGITAKSTCIRKCFFLIFFV